MKSNLSFDGFKCDVERESLTYGTVYGLLYGILIAIIYFWIRSAFSWNFALYFGIASFIAFSFHLLFVPQSVFRAFQNLLICARGMLFAVARRKAAVMYSDIRNFSERSSDSAFVEKELIPSVVSILDPAEENLGVAKQIADAVILYYSLPDPEEGLLRAIKDGLRCSIEERQRVIDLGRNEPERYFSITYGEALVGNIASAKHREATIIGDPANLAARLDALTKDGQFMARFPKIPAVPLSFDAAEVVKSFASSWEMQEVVFEEVGVSLKSFPNQKSVSILPASRANLVTLNQLLRINGIHEMQLGVPAW